MSSVAHKEGGFSLSRLLFGVVSVLFQSVLACYSFLWFVPLFTSDDVTECFDLQIYYKSTLCRFSYKLGQALLQSVVAFLYYKLGKVVLQSSTVITKWDDFYLNVGQVLTK